MSGRLCSEQRVIHVWDREGCQLHSTGEAAEGLLPPVCWQPNSRHLYAAQTSTPSQTTSSRSSSTKPATQRVSQTQPHPTQPQANGAIAHPVQRVLLYERNGLQHGSFDVPCAPGACIHDMAWSMDSELLAVVLGPGKSCQAASCDQQWTVQVRFVFINYKHVASRLHTLAAVSTMVTAMSSWHCHCHHAWVLCVVQTIF